jgi:hypothetical protein
MEYGEGCDITLGILKAMATSAHCMVLILQLANKKQ